MECRSHGVYVFFFQAEDGIRDLVRSRGLGDVYKRQPITCAPSPRPSNPRARPVRRRCCGIRCATTRTSSCLLYTSDAADERSSVDLGGRRIIKKKKCMCLYSIGIDYGYSSILLSGCISMTDVCARYVSSCKR